MIGLLLSFALAQDCDVEPKLGRAAEARRCYDRAVARLEATFPDEALTRRLRREAAILLGLEPADS